MLVAVASPGCATVQAPLAGSDEDIWNAAMVAQARSVVAARAGVELSAVNGPEMNEPDSGAVVSVHFHAGQKRYLCIVADRRPDCGLARGLAGETSDEPSTELPLDVMLQTIVHAKPVLAACASTSKRREPSVTGKAVLRFDIEPSGQTSNLKIAAGPIAHTSFARCLRAVFERLTFAAHPTRTEFVVFPLKL
jgi:hypothetical protein